MGSCSVSAKVTTRLGELVLQTHSDSAGVLDRHLSMSISAQPAQGRRLC